MKHEQKNDQLLTSWKEIAAHLGKGVRTAQRWEREIGLPVRRPAENRHIVVALATDLDNWIAQLATPSATPCCSCREDLDHAQQTIVDLREQIMSLQSEMKIAALALQMNNKVAPVTSVASARSSHNLESDGTAA
jgi:hypothetical protein